MHGSGVTPHPFLRRCPRPLGLLTLGAPRGAVSRWTPLSRLSFILPLFLSPSSPPSPSFLACGPSLTGPSPWGCPGAPSPTPSPPPGLRGLDPVGQGASGASGFFFLNFCRCGVGGQEEGEEGRRWGGL